MWEESAWLGGFTSASDSCWCSVSVDAAGFVPAFSSDGVSAAGSSSFGFGSDGLGGFFGFLPERKHE